MLINDAFTFLGFFCIEEGQESGADTQQRDAGWELSLRPLQASEAETTLETSAARAEMNTRWSVSQSLTGIDTLQLGKPTANSLGVMK